MLQLNSIIKRYKNGKKSCLALDHLTLNLRQTEFVFIHGPSGSGKTTLLHILGGLLPFESGTMQLRGISTAKFRKKDWRLYRNRKVGFVSEAAGLIPHQTVLTNVELALSLSGVSRKERRQKAQRALAQVGLQEVSHQKPGTLSVLQQRLAVLARAIVQDPVILLADEPTASLDPAGRQTVLRLLQTLSRDRLVVMTTCEETLARDCATRILTLEAGKIVADSNPYIPSKQEKPAELPSGRVHIGCIDAFSLSVQKLRTHIWRTAVLVFAGAIGLFTITLFFAALTGAKDTVSGFQQDMTLTYPVVIQEESLSLLDVRHLGAFLTGDRQSARNRVNNQIYANSGLIKTDNLLTTALRKNDLTAFRDYLEDPQCPIRSYLGEKGIVYQYSLNFQVYSYDAEGIPVRSDGDIGCVGQLGNLTDMLSSTENTINGVNRLLDGSSGPAKHFSQLMPGADGATVNPLLTESYDLIAGKWPENYDEVVLVLDEKNSIPTPTLYQLGLISQNQYLQITENIRSGRRTEPVYLDPQAVCDHVFYLVPACDAYLCDESGVFRYIGEELLQNEALLSRGIPLKIAGVIRPVRDSQYADIPTVVAYTDKLTEYLIQYAKNSPVVQTQQAFPTINILTGAAFSGAASLEKNLQTFGLLRSDSPTAISLYPQDPTSIGKIVDCIEAYNERVLPAQRIHYRDYIGTLTASVRGITDGVMAVLWVIMAVFLLLLTIILILIGGQAIRGRTGEMTILQMLGASAWNAWGLFCTEAVILGLGAGILGVVGGAALIPGLNKTLRLLLHSDFIQLRLPFGYGLLLIAVSVTISLVGYLISSLIASEKNNKV